MANVTHLKVNTRTAPWSSTSRNEGGKVPHLYSVRTFQRWGRPHSTLSRSTKITGNGSSGLSPALAGLTELETQPSPAMFTIFTRLNSKSQGHPTNTTDVSGMTLATSFFDGAAALNTYT
jgi:hypothetical protein